MKYRNHFKISSIHFANQHVGDTSSRIRQRRQRVNWPARILQARKDAAEGIVAARVLRFLCVQPSVHHLEPDLYLMLSASPGEAIGSTHILIRRLLGIVAIDDRYVRLGIVPPIDSRPSDCFGINRQPQLLEKPRDRLRACVLVEQLNADARFVDRRCAERRGVGENAIVARVLLQPRIHVDSGISAVIRQRLRLVDIGVPG